MRHDVTLKSFSTSYPRIGEKKFTSFASDCLCDFLFEPIKSSPEYVQSATHSMETFEVLYAMHQHNRLKVNIMTYFSYLIFLIN